MGMFDTVHCDAPLPDDCPERDFQTKDFENALSDYTITEDGRLVVERYDLVRNDGWQSHTDGPPFHRENERTEVVPFHGVFRFYTGTGFNAPNDYRWWEYEAKFTDGQLVEIAAVLPGSPVGVTDTEGTSE